MRMQRVHAQHVLALFLWIALCLVDAHTLADASALCCAAVQTCHAESAGGALTLINAARRGDEFGSYAHGARFAVALSREQAMLWRHLDRLAGGCADAQ